MMNESTLDYSNKCFVADLSFKFAFDFIKKFNAEVNEYYTEG